MWEDPIVEEIRKVREEHAARFNYDLDAIYQDLKRMQEESGREYVDFSRNPDRVTLHAPCSDSVVHPT
ncbi:MAG: hypothetical protein HQM04_18955 [Magnetococcales bacterium]|nr:hypothetical protein [Magnetococcales bacterium]MBF0117108.1 hypothetical protein [Magnetococcales bacterium]